MVPAYCGRRNEDAEEFLENLEFAVAVYPPLTTEILKTTTRKFIFRTHLKERALEWYNLFPKDVRSDWTKLRQSFVEKFVDVDTREESLALMNEIYQLRQGSLTIGQYVKEVERL